jgi:NodT family efflux transporter outer membrane factor (OMF) lipoprotein
MLALAAVLCGCAVGPDFHSPAPPQVNGYTAEPLPAATASAPVPAGAAQRFVTDKDIPAQWWTLFRSAKLDALIERSLQANPTIDAAKAALRQARELTAAQVGAYYPQVQASFSPSRQRNPVNTLSPSLASGEAVFNLYTAQVSVGYTPDVFGLNRRQVESLAAQAESQGFQLEASRLTLSSNVAAAAIQEASLRAQIAASRKIVGVASETLEILRRQRGFGYASGVDVAAQESLLAQVQQTLPPLQKQLAQTRDLLAALAGGFASEGPAETFELSELQLPEELPLSLPSRLVQQRPDVRAAEAQVHAASAQVGVALANRLPQFSITGAAGGTSTVLGQMFEAGNVFWSVVGDVTQPLFSGGTLMHKQRAAEAALDEATAQYRSTVITAFQNVADTLNALEADAEGLRAADKAENAARTTLELTRKQLDNGMVSYLALLSAQQAYQQALLSLAQAQANRYADTAALFQALGGGWWNRADGQAMNAAPSQGDTAAAAR